MFFPQSSKFFILLKELMATRVYTSDVFDEMDSINVDKWGNGHHFY